MSRTVTVIHVVNNKDDLDGMKAVIETSGGHVERTKMGEVYIDKTSRRTVKILHPYVLGSYQLDDMDMVRTKAKDLTRVRGIQEIIMHSNGLPIITASTLAKMAPLSIGSGLALLLAALTADAFQFAGEYKDLVATMSVITGFGVPIILSYFKEHSQRHEIKDAYAVMNGKLMKKTFVDYDYALTVS